MTSLLPPNAGPANHEDVPVAMDDVADTADVAGKLLELASRTSRTTHLHPDDERYLEIAAAIQTAADAAHHAAALIVQTAAQHR